MLEAVFFRSGWPAAIEDAGGADGWEGELFRDYDGTDGGSADDNPADDALADADAGNGTGAAGSGEYGDGESDGDDGGEVGFDPKNPGSSRYRNCEIAMAEPELYTRTDTGGQCGGFTLREGEITGLPIAPEDMFELDKADGSSEAISDWRLFLYDSDGSCVRVLEYHAAIRALGFLARYGEKYLIGEKDGYVVTTPLTRTELLTLAKVLSAAEEGEEASGADKGEPDDEGRNDKEREAAGSEERPYLTRLGERRHLFLPALLLTSFLNAASFIGGHEGQGTPSSGEQLALFLRSIALSAALFAGSYAVGCVLLSLASRLSKKKAHGLLKFIAIVCIIDILARLALLLVLRGQTQHAAPAGVCSFGTLFSVFDVWKKRSGDGTMTKSGRLWRILGVFFAALLWTCWHFLGLAAGSAAVLAVAILVFGGICAVNIIADGIAYVRGILKRSDARERPDEG